MRDNTNEVLSTVLNFEGSNPTVLSPVGSSKTRIPISSYFEKKEDSSVVFKGGYLEAYFSPTMVDHKMITISGRNAQLYGIFEIRIWDEVPSNPETVPYTYKSRYLYPSVFESLPTDMTKRTMSLLGETPEPYTVLVYEKGATFIVSTKVPKKSNYTTKFIDLLTKAFIPKIIKYEEFAQLIFSSSQINGVNFGVNAKTFEIMLAAQARYAKDLSIPYRIFYNKEASPEKLTGSEFLLISFEKLPHILDTFTSFSYQEIDYAIIASARRHRKGVKGRQSDLEKLLTY
jgi:hypothetical protein